MQGRKCGAVTTPRKGKKKMKTLKQIRADARVYEVINVSGQDFNEGIKYEISLNDGYTFSDGSSLAYAESVADLNDLLDDIIITRAQIIKELAEIKELLLYIDADEITDYAREKAYMDIVDAIDMISENDY